MSKAAERFCSFLPNDMLAKFCKDQVQKFVPWLNNMHFLGATPDLICQTLHFCTNKKGKFCYLFPQKTLKNYYKHLPKYDKDGDLYSQNYTFRGAYWRGKDCNDSNAKIHPGVKAIDSDVNVDSNCNGIYGTDSQGRPYEDLFCKNTNQRGFAVVGDSVAAHLHIPEEWFDAKKLSKDALKDVVLSFEDEFDWPQLSGMTGFMNSIWKTIKVKTDSIYFRLWERNHCNHRDYQNIGINGKPYIKKKEDIFQSPNVDLLSLSVLSLSFSLSLSLSLYLSAFVSLSLCPCLSLSVSLCAFPFLSLSVSLSLSAFVCLSLHLCLSPALFFSLFICLSHCVPVSPSVPVSLSLYLCVSLSLYLSLSLSL
ncbi:AOAH [Acanthosepion pharaonis]|uniref:AOAH n=1 Tax=Acanthosepion pharaonis TaxID=158019 RepID=A0A812D175_ACAPH|nr:AOAH [Sepia pharaonis]